MFHAAPSDGQLQPVTDAEPRQVGQRGARLGARAPLSTACRRPLLGAIGALSRWVRAQVVAVGRCGLQTTIAPRTDWSRPQQTRTCAMLWHPAQRLFPPKPTSTRIIVHPHHRRRGGGLAVRFGLAGVFVSDVRVVALRLRGIGGSACAASRTLVRTGWAPASALASTIATARSRSTGSASSQLWRSRASEGSGVTRYAAGTPSALASAWISREVGDARPRSYWLIRGAATLGDSPIRRPTAACEIPNASRAARSRVARTEPGPKGAATSGPGSHRGVHRMGKNARTR